MFDRNISLIGKENFNKLKDKQILIVGLGGVGGYAFETLVRSGFFYIDIIDYDIIDKTNLNRQIITNQDNVGEYKVDVAIKHAKSINPNIIVNSYKLFLDKDNINKILSNKYDYIIDACDSVDTKLELIKYSLQNDVKLISSMGTAKKMDPTKLSITTLDKTNYDPLAKVMRKKAKEFKLNMKKINVISSTEIPIDTKELGSFMMVPAVAGILCAKFIIENVIKFD